jgi:hypothetical protein
LVAAAFIVKGTAAEDSRHYIFENRTLPAQNFANCWKSNLPFGMLVALVILIQIYDS